MPAPLKNQNAMRHGLKAGTLPAGCKYIENATRAFRRQVEAAVLAIHGEVTVLSAALIQSAVRHETRAALLQRWLREAEAEKVTTGATVKGDSKTTTVSKTTGLSILDRASLLAQLSAATDSRDKCLERLKLTHSTNGGNPWASLNAAPRLAAQEIHQGLQSGSDGSTIVPAPANASEAIVGDSAEGEA